MNCTVKANIITENKNNILCRKCQGSCWVPGNNSETQKGQMKCLVESHQTTVLYQKMVLRSALIQNNIKER